MGTRAESWVGVVKVAREAASGTGRAGAPGHPHSLSTRGTSIFRC